MELLHQFMRFTGVGFASAVGHYGLLIALVQLVGVPAVPASTAGAVLGAWINYRLNRRFTFRSRVAHGTAIPRFAIVAVGGVALNALFMWIGVDLLDIHYLASQVATTGLVMLWTFSLHRLWTFRHRPAIQ